MKIAIPLLVATLTGCAATSTVAPAGRDTFMLTKQAATGFSGLGNMKAEVLTEANAHCTNLNRQLVVIKSTETQPPYILGNFPRVELHFRCE